VPRFVPPIPERNARWLIFCFILLYTRRVAVPGRGAVFEKRYFTALAFAITRRYRFGTSNAVVRKRYRIIRSALKTKISKHSSARVRLKSTVNGALFVFPWAYISNARLDNERKQLSPAVVRAARATYFYQFRLFVINNVRRPYYIVPEIR